MQRRYTMKITTIEERIEKANVKIEKKQKTIEKYHKWIEKKYKELEKLGYSRDFTRDDYYSQMEVAKQNGDEAEQDNLYTAYWVLCDIDHYEEGIENNTDQIAETRKTIEKYEKQLAGELKKEAMFAYEMPEIFTQLKNELVENWDKYDKERRAWLKDEYHKLGYSEFVKKHNYSDYQFMYTTDDQIHASNERDAEALIINLYNRVKDITGEVTSWENIHATVGTWGGTVLNGYVTGKEGTAKVESIYAGGYNIQRLHVRVLVHAM